MAILNNKKGFILVVSYMVMAVLIILATSFASRSIGEERVASKERNSIQALWIAEAGLNKAIAEFPSTPLSGTFGNGAYSTQTTATGDPVKFLIVSKGGIPAADEANINNRVRTVRAIIEKPLNPADPSDITSAIAATGNIIVKGNAEINGPIIPYAVFNFQDVLGISKDTIRNIATHHYTDPDNNIMPVDQITWIDLTAGDELIISSSGWSGSGVLIVNGDLRITGGTFSGIIWVIGELRVSGNPVINGTIFVESGTEVDTEIVGTPVISYNVEAISTAFDFIPSELPPYILSWKED